MATTKKITCVITGKQTVYSGNFLQKKVEEYGSEDNLNRLYVCKEVKSFLKKGYKVSDIIKVLNIDEDHNLPNKEIIDEIESNYLKKTILKDAPTFNDALTGFTYNKSDPVVEKFITQYIM